MRGIFLIVCVAVLWPSIAAGGACSVFPWHYPRDMAMPNLVFEGTQLMQAGSLWEARELLSTYLLEQEEGVFAEEFGDTLTEVGVHVDVYVGQV